MNLINIKKTEELKILLPDYEEKIMWLDCTDSTNLQAGAMAKEGIEGVVLADMQEKGRGRGEHTFESPEGGLYLSISNRLKGSLEEAMDFQFRAAEAVKKAILDLGTDEAYSTLYVKYPNDIYLCGKKICGILCEGIRHGDDWFLVTGIGVNLTSRLSPELESAGSIEELTGIEPDSTELAAKIISNVLELYGL